MILLGLAEAKLEFNLYIKQSIKLFFYCFSFYFLMLICCMINTEKSEVMCRAVYIRDFVDSLAGGWSVCPRGVLVVLVGGGRWGLRRFCWCDPLRCQRKCYWEHLVGGPGSTGPSICQLGVELHKKKG